MKRPPEFLIIFIFLIGIPFYGFGQDSLKTRAFIPRKNVIRYNLTPNILGFNSAIFGYERVVSSHQSFSVNAGYLSFGKSGKNTNNDYNLTNTKTRGGFSVAVDYRFYLKRENKDPAPHGVYLAPYFVHYNLNPSNTIEYLDDNSNYVSAMIDSKIRINNFGLELGYQFNIKNRFTVDMILIGPSYAGYKVKMQFEGDSNIPEDEISDTLKALRDILVEKYPWLKTLVDEGEIDVKSGRTHWGLGFRYVLQVGYRF